MKIVKFAYNKKSALVQNDEGQEAWLKVVKKGGKTAVDLASFDKELAKQAAKKAEPTPMRKICIRVDSDKAVMIDFEMTVVRADGVEATFQKSAWLPKSQVVDGRAPAWLLAKKLEEKMEDFGRGFMLFSSKFDIDIE